MRSHLMQRCVACALILTLAAPAAWGMPRGGLGGWWSAIWEWFSGTAAKHGPSIEPDGSPLCAPLGLPEPLTVHDASKNGPCINPDGSPACMPSGGSAQAPGGPDPQGG